MPGPGATPIILYHSDTASAVPLAATLSAGELAVNVTDKIIYTKDGGGAVIKLTDTLAAQAANNVNITGGSIAVSTLSVTGTTTLAVSLSGIALLTAGVVSVVTAPAGSLVGTTDVQTLTNKTLSLTNTTLTGTKAQFNTAVTDGDFLFTGEGYVTASGTDTLTNKTISVDNNTISGVAASSFVLSNASGNLDGSVAQKVIPTGTVVGTTDTQTLTNKTLTTPVISSISNTGTLTLPTSTDTLVGRATTDTLTNKTISADDNTLSGIAASSFVLSNASGNIDGSAAQKVIPTGTVVGTTDTQTLTNKTISADNNTLSGIAASSFVLSNSSGNIDGSAAQKVIPTGTVVGTTDTQTLTNKTLTDPALIGTVTEDIFTITDAAAFEINPANGAIQLITLGANRTPAATNFDNGKIVMLGVNDGTNYTITWSTVNVIWESPGGLASAPTLSTTGITWILLWKVSNQIYGCEIGQP